MQHSLEGWELFEFEGPTEPNQGVDWICFGVLLFESEQLDTIGQKGSLAPWS